MNKFFKSKVFVFAFLSIVVLLCVVQMTTLSVQGSFTHASPTPSTSLVVKVVNLNDEPLANANVFVAETKQNHTTDKFGYTPLITVPYTPLAINQVVDGEFSCVNLVVTCDGYVDSILYNCLVFKNKTRNGPNIVMFDKMQTTAKFITTTEVPRDGWTKEFLQKVKEMSK